MRFLHTSDWHLGMKIKTNTMEEDQRFFFSQLYRIIEEEKVDAVVVAGDIYDSAVVNADAINLYDEVATTICGELKTPMIVIAGNHDSGPRLASCCELLSKAGLYVSGKLEKDIKPVSIGNTDFYLIPYFNRNEVIALYPDKEESIDSVEDAARVVCDNIRERMDGSRFNVVISHSYIVGAELSDSDKAAQVGTATAISSNVFEGFDYVALGHIHKPQVLTNNVRYSGSPIKYSFGTEEKQNKIVIIFDTETNTAKDINLDMRRDRRSITGTYDEIKNLKNVEDCYLNLTVTDRNNGLALLGELSEKYPYILELHGMNIEATGTESSLSISDLGTMSDKDIMMMFLREICSYEPTEDKMKLYEEAVNSIDEGELG